MIKTLMYILLFPLDLISLFFGICVYKISKKTPYFSYKSMHRLFYIFGGIVTEFINILTKNRITKTINYNGEDNSEILKNLNENGLFVKENFLNLYEIEEIKKILLNYEFSLRKMDGEVKKKTNEPKKYKFNPESPKAVMYSVDSNFLINQRIIQEILLKNEIYDIGRKYFGAEPIFTNDEVGFPFEKDCLYNLRSLATSTSRLTLSAFTTDAPTP